MARAPSPRPLTIKGVTIFFVLTGVAELVPLPDLAAPMFAIWLIIEGPAAVALHLALAGLAFYVAFGVWRLSNTARVVGIGYQCLMLLATLAFVGKDLLSMRPAVHGLLLIHVLVVWFLIKRKAAFVKPATA